MKANANVSLQVIPRCNDADVIPIVDKIIAYIKSTGVIFEVGPMETTMEGNLDVLLDIVKQTQKICIQEGANSVISMVKISYNENGVLTIAEKTTKHRL